MCGIAGIISSQKLTENDVELGLRMRNTLHHRGPDTRGFHASPQTVLGICRLGIIDQETGDQPLWNEDGSIGLVANGEIYNFKELRYELERGGHVFRTGSDCETIVHLYEEHGPECVHRLRGMFAFALLDTRRKRVLLARDRMGEKPLYLHETPDRVYFSSELKTLLSTGIASSRLHPDAVCDYLFYGYIPEPLTVVDGVRKLPPAHYLIYDTETGRREETCYWRMEEAPPLSGDPVELIHGELDLVAELLIRSDVPIGIALSGGLDSSAVAALIATRYPGLLQAFCVGYEGRPPSDERRDARRTADALGIPFHETEIRLGDMTGFFPELVSWLDDPIADFASFGYYAVMRLASEHGFRVMLSGSGGDELFWGYAWVRESVKQAMEAAMAQNSPSSSLPGGASIPFYDLAPDSRIADREVRYLLTDEVRSAVRRLNPYGSVPSGSDLRPDIEITRMIYRSYLLENGIAQNDRLSMASSVEPRLPLLDYRFVETVMGLKKAESDALLEPKARFREAVSHLLPSDVLHRPKKGFSPPVIEWHQALMARYGGTLHDGYLVQEKVFVPERARGFTGDAFPPQAVIPLGYKALVLETWCRSNLQARDARGFHPARLPEITSPSAERLPHDPSPDRDAPFLSIVFATRNRLDSLKKTIASISRELDHGLDYEIVVVDGQSSDGTCEYLASVENVRVIPEDRPRGCCFAYDLALREARGEWVCWLNDDIDVCPGSFSKMISFMTNPENARVGMGVFTASKNRNEPENFVLETCMSLPIPYACFGMIKRDLLKRLDYLDLNYQKYGWDPDLALKVWDAGYSVEPCPGAHIIHYFIEDDLREQDEGFRAIDCNYLAAKWRDKTHAISSRVDLRSPNFMNTWDELPPALQTRILVHAGKLEEAEEIVLREFESDSRAIEIFYLMGIVLAREGEPELASRVYLKVIDHADKDPKTAAWAHYKYGEYLEERGDITQSRAHWNRAIQLDPDHAKSHIRLIGPDEPLRVLISPDKGTTPGSIWIPMNTADGKMWDYYFSSRKIDDLEIHCSTMNGSLDGIPEMLRKYLNPGVSFRIRFPQSEPHDGMALHKFTRELSQRGLEIDQRSSYLIAGRNPSFSPDTNDRIRRTGTPA